MLKRWAEVINGKSGLHGKVQLQAVQRHQPCPGGHTETGEWVDVKAMEGAEGGFEAELSFLCDGDCDCH